ncbi:MAG: hypothetical protein WA584_15130 [Pyrinomonadaceae bacterium]
MKLIKLMLFACILCLSANTYGQNVQKTLEKPYQQWSQEEAMKIVSAKPFADQYQSTRALTALSQQQQNREQSDTRMSGNERGRTSVIQTIPPVVIRLHSALPVRQALVRLRQIQAGYDKMKEDDRKKFDESQKVLLNCAICQNYYVVTLTKWKDTSASIDDGLFQEMKFEDFKGKVWLVNDKGERREVAQFTPPKGTGDPAIFFFKRTDENGNPLLTTETKEFKFLFDNSLLDMNNDYGYLVPRSFDFSVSKIIIDNKVEF